MTRWVLLLCAAILAGCGKAPTFDTARKTALVAEARPSAVVVQMTLCTDQGESPHGGGFGRGYGGDSFEQCISDERPFEMPGWLVGPATVVTQDPHIASRFIREVKVRLDNDTVAAKVSAFALNRDAIFIETSKPLKGAKPLAFTESAEPPYFMMEGSVYEGELSLRFDSFSPTFVEGEKSGRYLQSRVPGLVVDREGRPAGVWLKERLSAEESWKGSPLAWNKLTAEELAKRIESLDAACRMSIVRVRLGFRSPAGERGRGEYDRGEGGLEGGSTEVDVSGLVTAPDRVLVPAMLKPDQTARLQRIFIWTPDNGAVAAKFVATLSDYGAFVVKPDRPVGPPAKMAYDADLRKLSERLLLAADVRIQGENRVVHFTTARFDSLSVGWRRHLYPEVMGADRPSFLFDESGALVAAPVARRTKAGEEDYRHAEETTTPVAYLRGALADPAAFADANNVPLSENEENRCAWLGAEFQPLNRELARLNKVSDLTHDGDTGAIVTYIYPDSPADKGGVKLGDILLRLYIEGYPKPVDVHIDEWAFSEQPFPWEHLDQMPERVFDTFPCPWPGIKNSISTLLTEAGFGKKVEAEVFRDGKTLRLPFVVTEAPAHYESAPRWKSKALGMTVRDMTFEVLRYFQRTASESGVIVSNLEAGSKASVAGIKPFEIILEVNDKPVHNAKEFEAAAKSSDELRLNVLRRNKTRIVKISLKAADAPAPPAGN